MPFLDIDFEGFPIGPGNFFPEPVCAGVCTFDVDDRGDWAIDEPRLVVAEEAFDILHDALVEGYHITNANLPFDVGVAYTWCPLLEPLLIQALNEDRLHCQFRRQVLIDSALGKFRGKYSADTLAEEYGLPIPDKKHPWRLRFGELKGVAIDDYPQEAYDYAIGDPFTGAQTHVHQERVRYIDRFGGRDCLAFGGFSMFKGMALADMASCGMQTDGWHVDLYEAYLKEEQAKARDVLLGAGLVRPKITKNKKAIAEQIAAWNPDHPTTPKGEPSLAARHLKDAPAELAALVSKSPDAIQTLIDAGLADLTYVKNTWRARWAMAQIVKQHAGPTHYEVDGESYRIPHDEVIANAIRQYRLSPKDEDCKRQVIDIGSAMVPRSELFDAPPKPSKKELAELDEAERNRLIAVITAVEAMPLDADACKKSDDPKLQAFAVYSSCTKTLGNDIALARRASTKLFHTRYYPAKSWREITGAGETTGKGNLQNMPRPAGIRECWIPPEGWVFVSCDYPAIELRTFAQICLWEFGFSEVARKLIEGIDLHLEVAADLYFISYEEAMSRYKAGDFEMDQGRTCGKALNFGVKGNMKEWRFIEFAWKSYGVSLGNTDEERFANAQRLLAIHETRTPEFVHYSRDYVGGFRRGGKTRRPKFNDLYDLTLPYTGALLAGATSNEAHNTPFQHLAAVVGGLALVEIFQARRGFSELGKDDPLYLGKGCESKLWVHDDAILAVPEDRGHDAAMRLGEIMRRAAEQVLPDLPTPVEPVVSRQLSKLAKATYDSNNRLVPWDVWEQGELTYRKITDVDPAVAAKAATKFKAFPPYVKRLIEQELG